MEGLDSALKGFLYIERVVESREDGAPPPPPPLRSIEREIRNAIRDCGISISHTMPINPDHIAHALNWMEVNRGNFQIQEEVDKTY